MREMSLAGFVSHLAGMDIALRAETHHSLERAAKLVQREAKAEIGHYQGRAGQFAGWAELADATKDDRVRKGFTENDPGLRSGGMRDSIRHAVEVTGPGHGKAVIGSNDDHMTWFELGTSKQPPRAVLGGAAVRKAEEVARILGEGVVIALTGEGVHGGGIKIR